MDKLRNKLRRQPPKGTSVRDFRNNPREPFTYTVGKGSVSDKYLLDILVNPLKLDSTVQDTKENRHEELDAAATQDGNKVSAIGVNQSQDETLDRKIASGSKSTFWIITIAALSLMLCAYIITTLSRKN
ncbi:MAG TPA: hypothetical protein VMX13_15905 [Sedimentisphaerales bacterium]|nr:hypothetical protein [Sedimentisphaerales bacterium]